jgi:hypothetical protein
MTTALSVPSLRVCPDCGGILERTAWTAAVDVAAAQLQPESGSEGRWRCLICGFDETRQGRADGSPAERTS